MINLPGRVALSVNAVLEMDALPPGTTSIVSQSGTMLGTVLSRGAARGLGFAKLVSVGNEADIGVGELVELLAGGRGHARDPAVPGDGARRRAARRGGAPGACRGQAGRRLQARPLRARRAAARSHTGALAGDDAALDAYFRDCGIVRVDMLETLIEIGPLLAGARHRIFIDRKSRLYHHRRRRGERGRSARHAREWSSGADHGPDDGAGGKDYGKALARLAIGWRRGARLRRVLGAISSRAWRSSPS